jgi:cytoskeleton protein RodZ
MNEGQAAGGIGAALAQGREALGLTIGDVAQQLKFAPRQIEALEQDNFGALPGGTFARGMVRAYARLVRLDPEPLVSRMAATVTAIGQDNAEALAAIRRPIPITDSSRRGNLVYAVLSLAILAAIGAVIVEWQAERSRAARLTFVPAAQAPAPATPAPQAEAPRTEVASTVTPRIATLDTAPAAAPAATPAAAPAATLASSPASAPAAPSQVAAAEPPEPAPKPAATAAGARRIALRFEQESWVEIRGRGDKLLMAQLNPAGSERTVEGRPPFSVVIGNAHHVRITYEDRPVDLTPHIRVEVARFTLE